MSTTVGVHLSLLAGVPGMSLRLFPRTSGSIANGAGGDTLTESGTGYFMATVAESLTGLHRADVFRSGASLPSYSGWVNMNQAAPIVDDPQQINPVSGATVVGRYDDDDANYPTITCIVGETSVTKSVTVSDANGDPVDLTDWGNKILVIERPNKTADVQVVANAAITISGASNEVFTFQPSETVLAKKADYVWSLREESTGDVIVQGRLAVSYSPLEDTP